MYKETYKLEEKELIALIQGKSINFMVPDKFHIEVKPPNHGITLTYTEWQLIKTGMMNSPYLSYAETLQFIEDVESRKKR
jgi:hypothetical protein